ncbi:MAG: DUF4340 domain-containing protein [Candidatus Zixiibacteriota bacterium]|nr:MAG: DUF4340 domain-containing protein [candidate division Zixibacteria bacterium]
MNENKKTLIFLGAAVVLLILALITSPGRITPEAFLDQGELFFPDFTDPNTATTLEVIDFDEATGVARPFKVTFKKNAWTIPSHHDYPADAGQQLAKTAASIIELKKDEFRTDNVSDHEACGVIDPFDETAGGAGRGQRVTVRDGAGAVLADFIVGRPVETRSGFRYVRVSGQNRVYAVNMPMEISTRFEDWIDTDLLRLEKYKIERVILNDYSVNERTLSVDTRDNLVLTRTGTSWTANNMAKDEKVDSTLMQSLLTSLDVLSIVGVRPKPEGLSASLKVAETKRELTQGDLMSLQDKGFYLSREGQLLSNEGEMQVYTADGVYYTLRFGEVVYGSGLALTAGVQDERGQETDRSKENRYLFITAEFNEGYFRQPPEPRDKSFLDKPDSLLSDADRRNKRMQDEYDEWLRKVETGRQTAAQLSERFADWYYVISGDSYDKIRLTRSSMVVKK